MMQFLNFIFLLSIPFLLSACTGPEGKNNKGTDNTPPEWARGVVWYQIFPERFNNGDTTNDPKLEDQQGCWPHELIRPWQLHPWTSDWYELQDYEKLNQKDIWYNITRRRYGGDLQGVIDKLDYLQELGIGAIYLNPVFVSPSHHKYDIASYHHIEPTFGPDPEGDWEIIAQEDPVDPETWQRTSADSLMLLLINQAHQRNIKIILDAVFNHCGYNFFAFQDLKENQKSSRYMDWFTVYSWDTDSTQFDYEGWWGVKDMPEFREDSNGLIQGPREYIFNITRRWMDPTGNGDYSKGIDGWRLDVADQVGLTFWKDWHDLVKSINPSAFLTGEVTGNIDHITPYLQGDVFGSVMNYNFSFITSEYFIHPDQFTTKEFDSALRELRKPFSEDINQGMQNLLGSHDTDRPLSRIKNVQLPSFLLKDNFFDKTSAHNPAYKTGKPDTIDFRIFKLMVCFQMTYPGAPMIYYGDELGMWGAKDPGCRKPMIWPEKRFDKECFEANGTKKQNCDEVQADTSLLKYYRRLLRHRNHSKALAKGDFKCLLIDDEKRLYAFRRICQKDTVIVLLNNSNMMQKALIPALTNRNFEIIFNREASLKKYNDSLEVEIPAYEGMILQNR
ncbi:MAG: glycoside hydrolase family 13 protein [Bacteroidales bacterium]|nr:glycoside hydrolase family 13 protein [Bacteroidales bacterium]MCF8387197.1 glycoside hydrolase family 13 protein [Bacteroidales bacterium]MCF8396754.1 glycoside hydrolase family 13 protein [Bacteroidales bacterium]